MSLKSILHREIRERGYLSLADMEAICHLNNYKVSNAERRLRKSESPNVEPVRKNGAIIGYRWLDSKTIEPISKKEAGLGFLYKVHEPITNFRVPL